ncbi:hypothetical protein, partial [Aeromonas hydrophila]|uniref:hypothetical protein n=1 Tax=Aeromonas hydrophila TaxID=644 RepID=UPI0036DC7B22
LLLIGKHLLAIIDRAIAPELVAVGIDGIYTVVIKPVAKATTTGMKVSSAMQLATSMALSTRMLVSSSVFTTSMFTATAVIVAATSS